MFTLWRGLRYRTRCIYLRWLCTFSYLKQESNKLLFIASSDVAIKWAICTRNTVGSNRNIRIYCKMLYVYFNRLIPETFI